MVDIYFIDYVDSIKKSECPVCDSVKKTTERFFSALIYESNSGAIEKYADSGGFCAPHGEKFISFVQSNPDLGGGLSAISLAFGQIEFAEKILTKPSSNKKLKSHFHCPACKTAELRESNSIKDLSDLVNSGNIISSELASSICYPHYNRLIGLLTDHYRNELAARLLEYLQKLEGDLLHYRKSYAHNSRESIYSGELWKKAIIKFTGKF